MAKHRNFDDQDVFYASWTDAIQEYIGTISSNIRLDCPTTTSVRIAANTGSNQVAIGIDGKWRYRSTNSQITISGSAATYDLHAVAVTDNNFTGPGNDPDQTDYNFELRQVASGGTPTSVAAYRKVAEVDWDGSKITGLRQVVGVEDATQPVSPTSPNINTHALRVRGISGQVEDIGAIFNNAGTKLFGIGPSGQLTLVNGAIVTSHINDSAVTTDKLANGAVTQGKLASTIFTQNVETKTAAYTLVTADAGKLIAMNSSSAQNVTINATLDLTVGQRIDVIQLGAGEVSFVGSSATVNGTPGLKLRARYSAATVVCVGTDSYVVVGDLTQ